jgi:hypothetical protein
MIVGDSLRVLYGQVDCFLRCKVCVVENMEPEEHVLAVILPCDTDGGDAAQQRVTYRGMRPMGVADISAVKAAIGRLIMGNGTFGIIDRTNEVWPSLYEQAPSDDDDDDE